MITRNQPSLSIGPVWPWVFALMVHVAMAMLLLIAKTETPASSGQRRPPQMLLFRLVPPPEGETSLLMKAGNLMPLPPMGHDDQADGEMKAGGKIEIPAEPQNAEVSDAEIANMLAKDRDALRQELQQLTQTAMSTPLPKKPFPLPPPDSGHHGSSAKGPEGAVRELNLDGFSQAIVDDIMTRYHLKVVTREIRGGRRGQSFLSSASRSDNEHFFGGMEVPAGIYEVFQLSRESIALMSRLEEQALKEKGLEPLKSCVIRIVFGIVKTADGKYELGVKSLEAEAI